MTNPQPGILAPVPAHARYLAFTLDDVACLVPALRALQDEADGEQTVVGLGQPLLEALEATIPGMKRFPLVTAPGLLIGAAPDALWLWLRGDDRGEILHRSLKLTQLLAPAFALKEIVDGFKHGDGRDLSGFEDGTENPEGDDAIAAGGPVAKKQCANDGNACQQHRAWHCAPTRARPHTDELLRLVPNPAQVSNPPVASALQRSNSAMTWAPKRKMIAAISKLSNATTAVASEP